jgi:hypothetical protein
MPPDMVSARCFATVGSSTISPKSCLRAVISGPGRMSANCVRLCLITPLGGQPTLGLVGVQQRRIDAVGQQGGQFPAQIRGVLQARSLSIAGPAARGCCAGPAKTETSERDALHSPGVLAQPIWCSTDVRSNCRIAT